MWFDFYHIYFISFLFIFTILRLRLKHDVRQMDKKSIPVRINTKLLHALDTLKAPEKTRTEKVAAALQLYVEHLTHVSEDKTERKTRAETTTETLEHTQLMSDIERLEGVIQLKDEVLESKNSAIDSLKSSLGWALSEFSQLQKVALPAPQEEAQEKRKWWHIRKRQK